MQQERRATRRARPEELSYIQFESAGGGIVVDASEQGLAFQVAAALHQAGRIQICVSPHPMMQINLSAEIAWMDQTKRSGGLRFTELSADARNQILQWLTKTGKSEVLDKKLVAPSCLPKDEVKPVSEAQNRTLHLLSPTPHQENTPPTSADAAKEPINRLCSVPSAAAPPAPFSREKGIFIFRPQAVRVIVAGLVIFVFLSTPNWLVHELRLEIGSKLVRFGEMLKGDGDSRPVASSSTPVRISNSNPGSRPSVPNPISETPAKETLNKSDPVASTQTILSPQDSTDSQPSDRAAAGKQLAGPAARGGRSTLARQLWSSLAAGDDSAEVALARLYSTGDGVPRNCEQARVLLRAASKNGNVEAQQEMRKLNKSACRLPRDHR